MLCATAAFGLSFSTYFLLPKYLAVELGADARSIGGLSAVAIFASVVAMPFIGSLVDRHSRKYFGILGALLFALASFGFLFVEDIGPLLWLIRLFQGASFTFFYVAVSTLATDLSPSQRLGQAIGLFGAVMISTNAFGPALAEWGASAFSWATVFATTVAFSLLAAVLVSLIAEPQREIAHHDHSSMLDVLRKPGLAHVLFVAILVGWTMGSLYTFHQPWALHLGFDQVSGYLIGFAISALFVRVGLGGLADRLGRYRVATVACGFYIAAPVSLIFLNDLGLVVCGVALGLSHGLFFPALNAVALDHGADTERGKAMAAYHGAFNIGFAAGSYFCGYLVLSQGYPQVFALAGVTCAVGFVLLMLRRKQYRSA